MRTTTAQAILRRVREESRSRTPPSQPPVLPDRSPAAAAAAASRGNLTPPRRVHPPKKGSWLNWSSEKAPRIESELLAVRQGISQELQRQALANILRLGALSALGSALVGGIMQWRHQQFLSSLAEKPVAQHDSIIPVIHPQALRDRKRRSSGSDGRVKQSSDKAPPLSRQEPFSWLSFLKGRYAESLADIPWYLPGVTLSGMVGIPLGWKLGNQLVNWVWSRKREDRLEEAREAFQKALLSQYDLTKESAAASRSEASHRGERLGRLLSEAWQELEPWCRALEKRGTHWTGRLAGIYLATALMMASLFGGITYSRLRRHGRRNIISKAMKRRRATEYQSHPSEIFAVPVHPAPAAMDDGATDL